MNKQIFDKEFYNKPSDCYLLMHTACMNGNLMLYLINQHKNFLPTLIYDRNTMIDKRWGEETDEIIHFGISEACLWAGITSTSRNTHHTSEAVSWEQHDYDIKMRSAVEKKDRHSDYNNHTLDELKYNKLAVKLRVKHNLKALHTEDGESKIPELMQNVIPKCVIFLDCENEYYFDRIIERAHKLRGNGFAMEEHLLTNNLEFQRENLDLMGQYTDTHVVDIGKLLFDLDDEEYKKLAKAIGEPPIENWQELIKDKVSKVY